MNLLGTSLIGAGRGAAHGSATKAVNAATGDGLDPGYHWASLDELDRAVRLADAAFGVLAELDGATKAALLRAIAQGIETEAASITERATLETALPAGRIQGEIGRTCGQLRLFASVVEEGSWVDARIDHADPARAPVPKPDVRSMLRPLGPVVVFSSSNFPLAFSVAGGDTASALAAGCPVIVKPHQGHLGTSEIVGQIVQAAVAHCGLPEGTFSLLYGPGREVGMALVKHPLVQGVGFTGSRSGGRALMDAAAARPTPIPVYAEMGSVNPVFLLSQALAERGGEIAKGLHASVTLGNGQFCTNPGMVFYQAGRGADAFIAQLSALMAATPAGAMLTSSIRDEYINGVARFASTGGVKTLVQNEGSGTCCGAALFQTDGRSFLARSTLMNEVFGPSTLLIEAASDDELLACARALEGQLTATIHATPQELLTQRELLSIVEKKAGRLVFNGFPTGVEVCHSMHHGGPYPATSEGRSTSVGTRAILRFVRPACFQNFPDAALPAALQDINPLGIMRLVDGKLTR